MAQNRNMIGTNIRALYGPPLKSEEASWEKEVEAIVGVSRITSSNLKTFSELLRTENDEDSYLISPSYYALTGRKGLWIHQEQNSFIPFCWHPNVPGQILVFPVRGSLTCSILQNFLQTVPAPPRGLRLARVKDGLNFAEETLSVRTAGERTVVFAPVIEHVLDWKYPVRVLSTELIANLAGPTFRYIRNHARQISYKRPEVRNWRSISAYLLDRFIVEWAGNRARTPDEISELVNLYQTVMSLSNNPSLDIEGLAVLINGRVEALTMWDIPNPNVPTANRFVNLCNVTHSGLADFVMNRTAKHLCAQGVKYLNIGGAETETLDQFKRKFMPAYSINLHSVEVGLHKLADRGERDHWGDLGAFVDQPKLNSFARSGC